MIGMNTATGRALSGLSHLYQSIAQILTTPRGSRLARRDFGSDLFELVDGPLNGVQRTRLYAATAAALMRWEPRLKLTRVSLDLSEGMEGTATLTIEGTTTETGQAVSTSVPLTGTDNA